MSKMEQKVESIKIDGDKLILTLSIDKDSFIEEDLFFYDLKRDITNTLLPVIKEEIVKSGKIKEIVEKVLVEVNWPEIVRSEVAQKVIKAVAQGY